MDYMTRSRWYRIRRSYTGHRGPVTMQRLYNVACALPPHTRYAAIYDAARRLAQSAGDGLPVVAVPEGFAL